MHIDVRPSTSRFITRTQSIESRHSFSYGPHYDPANVGFGLLLAHNEDVLQPGGGFDDHPHRGVEIVTWVVSGTLTHADDTGSASTVEAGQVQRLSTGSGVRHSEVNATSEPTRYLQMWLSTDVDAPTEYAVAQAPSGHGEFAVVASGREPAPLRLRQPQASLFVARLLTGESAVLPAAAFVHLFVVAGAAALGAARLGAARLAAGDAARIRDGAELTATATDAANGVTELLAWVMDAAAWRPP